MLWQDKLPMHGFSKRRYTLAMATATKVPLEVYLRSSEYEPDAEYVDGVIEERPVGEFDHAAWQLAVLRYFLNHAEWKVKAVPELRVQVSPTRFRVPDVTVLKQDAPKEQIITHPPLMAFEILSPEDTVTRMLIKLADYSGMGIEGIFVIDPATQAYYVYRHGNLDHVGGTFTVGRCQINFHEIEGLLT
jgi:Uma2 family endonuclease